MFQKSNTPKKTSDVRKATMADLDALITLFMEWIIQMGHGGYFNRSIVRAHIIDCFEDDLVFVQVHKGNIVGTLMMFKNRGWFTNRKIFGLETHHFFVPKKYSSRVRARALADAGRQAARQHRVPCYLHLFDTVSLANGRMRSPANPQSLCRWLRFHAPMGSFYTPVGCGFRQVGSTFLWDPLAEPASEVDKDDEPDA